MPALVVVVGVLAYSNSFSGVFLLDDEPNIVLNEHIQHLWPVSDVLAHRRRPVVNLSLALNYAIGDLNVWGYHAFNLGVHLLAALTLLGVVRRTPTLAAIPKSPPTHPNGATAPSPLVSPRSGLWMALVVSLIWVVHPLNTQSVTYVIQRGEALMGLFYLLTLYGLIRGSTSQHAKLWYAMAVASCALGMGSKAVMVTAPVMLLLYDRVFLSGSIRQALHRRWGFYLALAATWGILVAVGVVQGVLLTPPNPVSGVGFGFTRITPTAYAMTQPAVLVHYLKLCFWPHPLCLDYGWKVARSLADVVSYATVIAVLLAATLWAWWRKPSLGFLGAWFFLILAPTSSFIPIKDVAFEHRMYLPLAAVVILVVIGGEALSKRIFERHAVVSPIRSLVLGTLVVVIVASLALATVRRNNDYHSRLSMWRDVVAQRPQNSRGYLNLGNALFKADPQGALEAYRESARLDPDKVQAHHNIGNAALRLGKVDEAIREYRITIKLDPDYFRAHYNLANALLRQEKLEEAIDHYREVLRIEPDHADALCNLGLALQRSGKTDQAMASYRAALRINPRHVAARFNLGLSLRMTGQIDEAMSEFRRALKIDPHNTAIQRALESARSISHDHEPN